MGSLTKARSGFDLTSNGWDWFKSQSQRLGVDESEEEPVKGLAYHFIPSYECRQKMPAS